MRKKGGETLLKTNFSFLPPDFHISEPQELVMKVISSPGISEQASTAKKKKGEAAGFSEALSAAASGMAKTPSTGKIPPLMNVSGNAGSPVSNEKKTMLREMEGLLDVMDRYLQKMDNPRNSLRDIHPLVTEMADRAQAMLPLLDALPEGDGLRDLLNRMLVTATVETIKFNRGDYL